jgi:hypothetical protein
MTSCKCHKLQEAISSIQGRFCAESNSEKSDPMFPSGRPSKVSGCSSVSNIYSETWQYCPDSHQCLEASNSSRLHLSECHGNTSGSYSEFKKISVF